MKKLIIVVLCLLLSMNYSSNVLANSQYYYDGQPVTEEELNEIKDQLNMSLMNIPQPRFLLTQQINYNMYIENGYAICTVDVIGKQSLVSKVKVILHLQKMNKSGEFENVISWQQTNLTYHLSMGKSYKLASSGTYRIQVEYYVYDHDNNCEVSFERSDTHNYTK